MEILSRLVLILLVAFLAVPSAARGETGRFFPTIYTFEGDLYIDMSDERTTNQTKGKGLTTSDTFFTEKIVLTANGYVYHPRFLLFLAKIGGGISQEKFDGNVAGDSGGSWKSAFLGEYEFRTMLLPEHPYNLEVFALRRNPFVPGRVTWGINPVSISEGALFSYKKKPVTFRLGYTVDTIESSESRTDTDTLNTNANYNIENLSLAGAYSRSDSRLSVRSASSEFTNEKYSLQNQVRFFEKRFILASDVSQNSYDGQNPTTSRSGDRFTWTEQLNMFLPWDFDALLTYNHFRDTEKSREALSDAESEITSTTDGAAFSLTKKLYESLYAAYSFNYSSSKTFSGDFSDKTHSLNGTYTKKIPWGRFTAGGIVSRSTSDRNGASAVINEAYNAKILDVFPVNRNDIDEGTIRIDVKDPTTGAPVPLLRNTHYRVTSVVNPVTIQILAIPAGVLNPDPAFVYELRVTYLFLPESTEVEVTDIGYSLKLELFGGFFNPYYNYDHRSQKVMSGTLPGGPEETTTTTVGVVLQRLPYFLVLEHQENRSNINPSKRDRAEATFRKDMTPTTNLYVRAYYAKVDYLEGGTQPVSHDDAGVGGNVSIQRRFPRRNLTFTATGSYSRMQSGFDTETYAMNAALIWHAGKLDLSLGGNVSRSETGLDTGRQETMYQRVYLSIRRKLF